MSGETRTASLMPSWASTLLSLLCAAVLFSDCFASAIFADETDTSGRLRWSSLPPVPDPHGVAGPFVGVHNGGLIVAGGANFPGDSVWDASKQWHDTIYVLRELDAGPAWQTAGRLDRTTAYGMNVSTPNGVLCIGGNDGTNTFASCRLLQWDPDAESLKTTDVAALPGPCAYGQAALVGSTVYVCGGQSDSGLESAMANFWTMDILADDPSQWQWRDAGPVPWSSRAFNVVASQHNGYESCVYVMSGRRIADDGAIDFLDDVWEFGTTSQQWRRRADLPRPVVAGAAIDFGQSHVIAVGGDDGTLFDRADELKDDHPGFPKTPLLYHTITDTWVPLDDAPAAPVTTNLVRWKDQIVLPTGEVRPRVRTRDVWTIEPTPSSRSFSGINNTVLFGYLASLVVVGVYVGRRNRSTDDYFRGGKHIPWWAAGCSIFATMLSSLTFTGIPSKAFAQDWVYAVGNFMIPVVAFFAVFIALPFFRRIDATSAYEYLERRFNRSTRRFASASFCLFHIFRMAVVMSLTGLALAVATPLTPAESVYLMAFLSIAYSTFGGIEAVIWTDTLQTVVLLLGAVVALVLLVIGVDGGLASAWTMASEADKFRIANVHVSPTDAQVALWVVVLGAIGQHTSSYAADQAVVQRYMTTPDQRLAACSIWTNAVLSIPATLIFFGIGTALYSYYRSHPERLDPTIATDQVFPLFIANEMPVGLSGLIVAGVFAAAQSTVSTSMNSVATAIVTDFLKPIGWPRTDAGLLRSARVLTLICGLAGTGLALVFLDPNIRSLFDEFIKVVGLFMGVIGGLFLLGMLTRRANGLGAIVGIAVGVACVLAVSRLTSLHGFLYVVVGMTSTAIAGYTASLASPDKNIDLEGLTVFSDPQASAEKLRTGLSN